jgi:hypothetical protein
VLTALCLLLPPPPCLPLTSTQLEVTLGRIAMIGFVGLILNEAYFGRPFFPHLF